MPELGRSCDSCTFGAKMSDVLVSIAFSKDYMATLYELDLE
jgi:hypothetical protein